MKQTILITGGAGFIGSALIRHLIASTPHAVVNVDKLTYAADLQSLAAVADDPRYCLEQLDIVDTRAMSDVFKRYRPDAVVHLAAETHVDRSIDGPAVFINSNVVGTQSLLSAALDHWRSLDGDGHRRFRFHHVSTDEVFGSLGSDGAFTESSPYQPRSPYAASKAAADHLVRAWHETYGLPVVLTNCSNNYGPYQFPEKLIPLTIIRAMQGKTLPVYGTGENVRDWLYVDDHAEALAMVLAGGRIGESYNVGAASDVQNLRIVESICDILDDLLPPAADAVPRRDLITFVEDRPGHDFRYAIDATKIRAELSWQPRRSLDEGLRETVRWYLENEWWWSPHMETRYDGERLGLPKAGNGR